MAKQERTPKPLGRRRVTVVLAVSFIAISTAMPSFASSGTISRYAGGGIGDGVAATNAALDNPFGVAVDSAGNIYVADAFHNRIRKVNPAGVITTVAGTGVAGYSGDGHSAVGAKLNTPYGVAVDNAGSIYIADTANSRIRKVSPAGVITTVAGNGFAGYSGDGSKPTAARLKYPVGVTVDGSGNLYIADTGNDVVRKVTGGLIINTVAGNGARWYSGDGGLAVSASLNSPEQVAVDGVGNLYIADAGNHRIRKVSGLLGVGIITTYAGNGGWGYSGDGGLAANASLYYPSGVALDGVGNLYIADWGNHRIRKVAPSGLTITTVAGNGTAGYSGDGGPATAAALVNPAGVALDSAGTLSVTDAIGDRVRSVSPAGVITTVAGTGSCCYSGDGGPATAASMYYPSELAVDGAGNLYIADAWNDRVRKVSPAGVITTAAGSKVAGFAGDGGPATGASLNNPMDVAVDGAGNLYIADLGNNRIRKIRSDGVITTVAGNGTAGYSGDGGPAMAASLNNPRGLAVDGAGNLFIADLANNRIRKVSPDGVITTVAGIGAAGYSGDGGLATAARLDFPFDVTVDGGGNLYIADTYNLRVRKVDTAGVITTVAGNGSYPASGDGGPATAASLSAASVDVDAAGNLYIADNYNNRIRKVDTAGIITTVAGDGVNRYAGDGGPATAASLANPMGVALDAAGNLYIADTDNHMIRKVSA